MTPRDQSGDVVMIPRDQSSGVEVISRDQHLMITYEI